MPPGRDLGGIAGGPKREGAMPHRLAPGAASKGDALDRGAVVTDGDPMTSHTETHPNHPARSNTTEHLTFVLVLLGIVIASAVAFLAYNQYAANQRRRSAELESCVWEHYDSTSALNRCIGR